MLAISVQVNNETEIIKNHENLKELNASKDKFFRILSHDLRNPFNGLIGFSEILKVLTKDTDDSEIKECVESICIISNSTYKLLENLLNWARLQTDGIYFNPVKFNLVEKIIEIVNYEQYLSIAKKIIIKNSVSNNLIVFADIEMISTVIRNLLTNAIKFTKTGGMIEILSQEQENEFIITISDNGIGIPPEIKNDLFRIEAKVTRLGTNKEEGSGLGLILCKEYIDKNKGKLWVDSEVDSGTKFHFTIPKGEIKS
jgi:signal transduction histidine kinase